MEFHQLNYFLVIAEKQSIVKASQELHVSQSALSVALRDLDRELGFCLFDRDRGRLRLNHNGRYMESQVRMAFALINNAKSTITHNLNQQQKIVKCATNMTLGKVGEQFIRTYRKLHPETMLRIGFKGSLTFKHSLPDIEFLGTEKELPDDGRTIKILHERFMVAFSADCKLAKRPEINLRDLKSEMFIMTGPGAMQDTVMSMFNEVGYFPHVVSEVQLYSEVLNLVRAGLGYTIVPEHSWLDNPKGLAIKPIADVKRYRNIYALLPEGSTPSPAALTFFEFLRNESGHLFKQKTADLDKVS